MAIASSSVCVVNDITKDGAFDEAIEGAEVVAHLASPFHLKSLDPHGTPFAFTTTDMCTEYITPAVQGTPSVLNSASKDGSSVKRIDECLAQGLCVWLAVGTYNPI
ncbi:hypothetical protein BC826DRAFT_1110790 [Russula brevipes]|nr:hypothetical protein BC826DRAFT_1110790 [Russula brevipes]